MTDNNICKPKPHLKYIIIKDLVLLNNEDIQITCMYNDGQKRVMRIDLMEWV